MKFSNYIQTNRTYNELVEAHMDLCGKALGTGRSALVFDHPTNPARVIKVGNCQRRDRVADEVTPCSHADDPYLAYIEALSNIENRYFPKLYDLSCTLIRYQESISFAWSWSACMPLTTILKHSTVSISVQSRQ